MPLSTSVRRWLSCETRGGKRSLHYTVCLPDWFIVIISLPCVFLGWWTSEHEASKQCFCYWTRLPPEITLICVLSRHQSVNTVEVAVHGFWLICTENLSPFLSFKNSFTPLPDHTCHTCVPKIAQAIYLRALPNTDVPPSKVTLSTDTM